MVFERVVCVGCRLFEFVSGLLREPDLAHAQKWGSPPTSGMGPFDTPVRGQSEMAIVVCTFPACRVSLGSAERFGVGIIHPPLRARQ